MNDELGRISIGDYVGDRNERLFHVGRLDADTEGLLILTNDGELAHRLQHPQYGVLKTYLAQIRGPVPRDIGKQLREGIQLEDGPASVDSFKVVDSQPGKALVEVILHEGRKHIVRRLLDAVGHPVLSLVRVQVGPIYLGDTKPGKMRKLNKARGRPAVLRGWNVSARIAGVGSLPVVTTSVRIVGTGLIGTSLGIALTRAGYAVVLADPSPHRRGAGARPGCGAVARPRTIRRRTSSWWRRRPTSPGAVVADELAAWPDAVVTDVASVKVAVLEDVRRRGADLTRYAGSHPMAGRERSGAVAARGDLFDGRAWVVVPNDQSSDAGRSRRSRTLAVAAGGTVSTMGPAEHDAAVAVVSHVPQLASSPGRRAAAGPHRSRGGPVGTGNSRRHPGRCQRPAAVDPDPGRQRRGRARGPRPRARRARPRSSARSTS